MENLQPIKAGHFYAAKYHGNNGDLIVGKVKSVRVTGEVVLINLLSDKIATKKVDVLRARNKRISASQADRLLSTARLEGKAAARKLAVSMKPWSGYVEEPPTQPKINLDIEKEVHELVNHYFNDLHGLIQQRTNQFIAGVVDMLVRKGE